MNTIFNCKQPLYLCNEATIPVHPTRDVVVLPSSQTIRRYYELPPRYIRYINNVARRFDVPRELQHGDSEFFIMLAQINFHKQFLQSFGHLVATVSYVVYQ